MKLISSGQRDKNAFNFSKNKNKYFWKFWQCKQLFKGPPRSLINRALDLRITALEIGVKMSQCNAKS